MIFIRRHAIQTEQDNYMQTPSKFLIGQEKNQITVQISSSIENCLDEMWSDLSPMRMARTYKKKKV